nr:hypothetical protein [Novosphingobium sp. G106]
MTSSARSAHDTNLISCSYEITALEQSLQLPGTLDRSTQQLIEARSFGPDYRQSIRLHARRPRASDRKVGADLTEIINDLCRSSRDNDLDWHVLPQLIVDLLERRADLHEL